VTARSADPTRRRLAATGKRAVNAVVSSADREPTGGRRNRAFGPRRSDRAPGDGPPGDGPPGDGNPGDGTRDDRSGPGSTSRHEVLRGFPPIVDRRTETLILGSFPSEASLAAGQYYAHPRNQFWRLLGACLGEPLADLDYGERGARVLAHRVGIWDVLDACRRPGSLDAAIRDPRPNDFAMLREVAPALKRVLFNGATAARFARRFAAAGLATAVLPSSSPAHAGRSYEQKLALWRSALWVDR